MSLSLDFSGMLENAGQLVNGLFPAFLIPIGFGVGMGILRVILGEIRKLF